MLWAYGQHPDAFTSTMAEREALPLAWWLDRLAPGAGATREVWGIVGPMTSGSETDGGGQQCMGAVGIEFHAGAQTCHKATLFGMVLKPELRGRGWGQALMDVAMRAASARGGVELLQLTVSEHNVAATALYRRCGFEPFGLEPRAVKTPEGHVGKLHMWRPLA
jgi:ribosomal protein S18 acetylase RimI-like enzyme